MTELTNIGLVKHCIENLGTHYLYGAKGQKVTAEEIHRWADAYPYYYGFNRLARALKWVGERATDCSGLISSYTNMVRSSGNFLTSSKESGSIHTIPEIPGLGVWRNGHIGVYLGDGKVIEAKGFDYGVIRSKLSEGGWTRWLKIKDIKYIEDIIPDIPITKRSPELDIKWLQSRLNKYIAMKKLSGINNLLVVDGIWGEKTAAAVLAFFKYKEWTSGKATGYYVGKGTLMAINK